MAFGLSKKPANQGGISGVHTAPSRLSGVPGSGASKTPGLTPDAAKTNMRPAPKGGSKGKDGAKGPQAFKG